MNTVFFKDHAVIRMLERNISKQEVIEILKSGEIIERYDDDMPYPSCLMFGMVSGKPLHVVVADNISESQKIIITVYNPDSSNFGNDFKSRIA